MSGLDPLASAGGNASAPAADPVAAELQALAADAQALRALLLEGDVVTGTVLRFNGLTDLLDIFGLRVAASLPPTVHPGDALTLEVQGFNGDTILVKLIATEPPAGGSIPAALVPAPLADGAGPAPEAQPAPLPSAAGGPQTSPPATDSGPALAAPQPAAQPAAAAAAAVAELPPAESAPAAPPASVFVAASVQPSTRPAPEGAQPASVPPLAPAPETLEVEARLALTRAAQPPSSAPRSAPPPAQRAGDPAQTVPAQTAAAQRAPGPPPARTAAHVQAQAALAQAAQKLAAQKQPATPLQAAPVQSGRPQSAVARQSAAPPAAPPAAPRAAAPPPATPRGAYLTIGTRAAERPQPQPIPGAPAQIRPAANPAAGANAARTIAIVPATLLDDPTALLRTLRIPVSPTSLTFAKLVTREPEQVATALRALETSLPNVDDSRIQTLRTLAAFVGRLDPKAPTFATQVASFMAHVIEGPEAKLAALLIPPAPEAPAQPAAPPAATPQTQAGAQANQAAAPQPPPVVTPAVLPTALPVPPLDPSAGAAHAAERVAAASHDLKTQLLAILAAPGGTAATLGDAGTAVAQNALTAVVVNQLATLAAQQPGAWTFTIPIVIERQLYPAKVRIDRDKGDGKESLTGDDFHIAFILETPRLGTVAIDMRAVGRSVSVSVKTEREGAVTSFKAALRQLGERLESMRYNVKSLDASLAPHRPAAGAEAPAAAPAEPVVIDPAAMVDRRA